MSDYHRSHRFRMVDCPSNISHSFCVTCGVSMMHERRRLPCTLVDLTVNVQQGVQAQPGFSIITETAQRATPEAMRRGLL